MILILFLLLFYSAERIAGLIPGEFHGGIWGKTQQKCQAEAGLPGHQDLQKATPVPQGATPWQPGLSGSAGRRHLPVLCRSRGGAAWCGNDSSSCVCSAVLRGGNSWWSRHCVLRPWDHWSRLVRVTYDSNADTLTSWKMFLIVELNCAFWNAITHDHSGYVLRQWETILLWSIISHWQSPYPEWSRPWMIPGSF